MNFLGLDLGGTNIKAVLLDGAGPGARVVASARVPTGASGGPAAVAARLAGLARQLAGDRPVAGAAGVGVPGLFDPGTGTVRLLPNLPGPWAGFPLGPVLAGRLGRPVHLVNDARAFTLAEARLGAGAGARSMVGVTLGTGVGGGIVLGGRLHLGAWGVAGELGHQTVDPSGPPCGCGNRGCVEAFTRAGVLSALAGVPDVEAVYAGVRRGDPRCRQAVATVAGYLGVAIANVVTLLGPELVVIGGGIAAAGELVLEPVRAAVRERVRLVPAEQVAVVGARLGVAAGAIGAALAAADAG